MNQIRRSRNACRTQVFITSDWHLGGSLDNESVSPRTIGTSIFRSTSELTAFLDGIYARAKSFKGVTELVLNGDIVDFLSPNPANGYVPTAWQTDTEILCSELDDIAKRFVDENGRGPFAALRDLATAGVKLFVLIGNHDLELCLPGVRERFIELIGGGEQVRFLFDGEAYTCGRLLVEHGNQYDRFNAVNFDSLRRERSELSRGSVIPVSERGKTFFQPPIGSSIVVNEVNPRLQYAPFLNLLKPEASAAIPLMLAMYPETRGFFELAIESLKIKLRTKNNTKQRIPGLLSYPHADLNSFLQETLGEDADVFISKDSEQGLLSGRDSKIKSMISAVLKTVRESINAETPWQIYLQLKATNDSDRLKQLTIALRNVQDDAEFETDSETEEYLAPARRLMEQAGFSVVVFGHTHLPKAQHVYSNADSKKLLGRYLNSGTWADTLRLPSGIRSRNERTADETISKLLKDFQEVNYAPYTLRRLTYVEAVVEKNGTALACLREFGKEKT